MEGPFEAALAAAEPGLCGSEGQQRCRSLTEGEQSFKELLDRLNAIHEEQTGLIQKLTDENASLREKLPSPSFVYSQPIKLANAVSTAPARTTTATTACWPSFLGLRELARCAGPATGNLCALLPVASVQPRVPGDEGVEVNNVTGEQMEDSCPDSNLSSQMFPAPMTWPIPRLWPEWNHQLDTPKIQVTGDLGHLIVVEDTTGEQMTMKDQCFQRLIIRPNSALRLFWDFLSSLMVAYDVVTIPLMAISLDKENVLSGGSSTFTDRMDWVTTSFWSVDVLWSFMTGFHADGVVEMRLAYIAKHYIQTWFLFDALIIVMDWSILAATMDTTFVNMVGWFRAGKTARLARILRTVRLLRFVKLQQALSEMLELVNSETVRAFFNVALAVLFIFGINHYLACGWFLMGHMAWADDRPNWILQNDIQDATITYAYFTALHWSLTQFTPAGMEIRPYNLGERVYSIVCLVFALITFSSFLGSITASITQLRKNTTEASRQKFILRAYFTQNRVSSNLSKTIWTYLVKKHFCHQVRSHKAQVEILRLLPPHLQGQLHQELYGPYITRAPFFYHYVAFSSEGLTDLCLRAISEHTLIYGETLFMAGKAAEKMFFTASGHFIYEHPRPECSRNVSTGSWISEAVLWVKWVHVANLVADTSAEIIALDSAKFRRVVDLFKHSLPFVQVYAQRFHAYIESLGTEMQTDLLTDLPALENLTRTAWFEVCSSRERDLYMDMPETHLPRVSHSRTDRVRSIWHRPAKPTVLWWRPNRKSSTRTTWSSSQ